MGHFFQIRPCLQLWLATAERRGPAGPPATSREGKRSEKKVRNVRCSSVARAPWLDGPGGGRGLPRVSRHRHDRVRGCVLPPSSSDPGTRPRGRSRRAHPRPFSTRPTHRPASVPPPRRVQRRDRVRAVVGCASTAGAQVRHGRLRGRVLGDGRVQSGVVRTGRDTERGLFVLRLFITSTSKRKIEASRAFDASTNPTVRARASSSPRLLQQHSQISSFHAAFKHAREQ